MRYSIIIVVFVLLSSCTLLSSINSTKSCCNSSLTIINLTPKRTETGTRIINVQTSTITSSNIDNSFPLYPELSWIYKGEVEFSFPLMSNSIKLEANYYYAICGKLLSGDVTTYYSTSNMEQMGWVGAGLAGGAHSVIDTYYYKPKNIYLSVLMTGCEDNTEKWCISIWISK